MNRTDSRTVLGFALGCLALFLVTPFGLNAQTGGVEERSAMDPASESATVLNTTQQAHMDLLSGQRNQKQARKYEEKAAKATSDSKREKLKGKAKAAFENAIRDYVSALRKDDTLDEAYVGLGQLFAKAGQYEQSMESFGKALTLDPENTEAMIGQARGQLATFKVEDAKTSYTELAKVDGESAGGFLGEMRNWLEGQKSRLGPEAAPEVTEAMTQLDLWISENEGS